MSRAWHRARVLRARSLIHPHRRESPKNGPETNAQNSCFAVFCTSTKPSWRSEVRMQTRALTIFKIHLAIWDQSWPRVCMMRYRTADPATWRSEQITEGILFFIWALKTWFLGPGQRQEAMPKIRWYKFEARNPKFEANPNVQNSNDQNKYYLDVVRWFVLSMGNSDFRICFGFRDSNFWFLIMQ